MPARASRSVGEIIRANVLTRFNAIVGVLFAIILVIGPIQDGLFGFVIIINTLIGIVQELRAKQTLERLAIVGEARPRVRRDGVVVELSPSGVVLDDVIDLGPGDKIVVDGVVLVADGLEVDESLLTGESDPVHKQIGDQVLSGSFVTVGSGAQQATKVGREAYAAQLAEEASRFTLVSSELRNGINTILKVITYLLVPAAALIIWSQFRTQGTDVDDALRGMVAALVPMVPEGLVLLTSIAFAVGVVRLGKRQCLVQELPAIEGLARVDVVCADKTGTLTENGMRLAEVRPFGEHGEDALRRALGALGAADPRPNASLAAVAEAAPIRAGRSRATVPFSSARKWSGASFGDEQGHWLLGAPDVLLPIGSPERVAAEEAGSGGLRVLLLVRAATVVVADADLTAPDAVVPVALVRAGAARATGGRPARWPTSPTQDVEVKVISGDNAPFGRCGRLLAGAARGRRPRRRPRPAGRPRAAGRRAGGRHGVRPGHPRAEARHGGRAAVPRAHRGDDRRRRERRAGAQGRRHRRGHGLGQPGHPRGRPDRAAGQLLRHAAARRGRGPPGHRQHRAGRQPVPHQDRLLGASWPSPSGSIAVPFPFLPRHLTLIGALTIGIPAFFLALAPNTERARTGFVRRVLRLALPSGVIAGAATVTTYLLARADAGATPIQQSTAAVVALYVVATWVLAVVARPYAWWKVLMIVASLGAFCWALFLPIFFGRGFWAARSRTTARRWWSRWSSPRSPPLLVEVAYVVVGRSLRGGSAKPSDPLGTLPA